MTYEHLDTELSDWAPRAPSAYALVSGNVLSTMPITDVPVTAGQRPVFTENLLGGSYLVAIKIDDVAAHTLFEHVLNEALTEWSSVWTRLANS
ncbi:MAG: hypothetical protein IH867_13720 [Chloroflexi bacterium]|nr:hypothetical protein [Chloroflexota bacterium]